MGKVREVMLYFTEGKHDKEYRITQWSFPPSHEQVVGEWGRRGSLEPNRLHRNRKVYYGGPFKEQADGVYDRLLSSKVSEGYTLEAHGIPGTHFDRVVREVMENVGDVFDDAVEQAIQEARREEN
jgi:hypothetical protein